MSDRIALVCRLSNDPDAFRIPCPACGGEIEVPAMTARDTRPAETVTAGGHLCTALLRCPHCPWELTLVFPMRGPEQDPYNEKKP